MDFAFYNLLNKYASISEADFHLASPYFVKKDIKKGEYFNVVNTICKHLAYVNKGLFRIYLNDPKTGEEKNLFFFTENMVMVSIKSFMEQSPCLYTIQALEDSEITQISHAHLMKVYQQSHQWESFGRLLAEQHFNFLQKKMESFLFQSAEERYLSMLELYPDIFQRVPLYHIASYLGIQNPSLSRIRKKLSGK